MKDKAMNEMPETENVGIMQGFLDSLNEEGDDELDDDGYGAEMMLERRPDSPEILMNNLRGDMRSIDARRDELADLVGYEVAAETPEPVLAMLQPILAQGGGIGALPQSGPMAQGPQPPLGMPPGVPPGGAMPPPPQQGGIAALLAGAGGGAPPGPPPGAPPLPNPATPAGPGAPVGMARGGPVVQRFQTGSDEDGVTPGTDTSSGDLGFRPTPEMVARARQQMLAQMSQQPVTVPDLKAESKRYADIYKDILGSRSDLTQAQMLFGLGQRALGFAANVDDQGRPLRGSFISRLAGAARTLPSEMSQYINQMDKEQRQLQLLGVQAAEKNIASTKDANLKLLETQRKGWAEVLKADSKATQGVFGSSLTGRMLAMFNEMAPKFARGELTPEQDNQFLIAATQYTQPTQIESTDPLTGEKSLRTQRNVLPDVVSTALAIRKIKLPTMDDRVLTATGGGGGAGGARVVPAPVPGQDPTTLDAATQVAVNRAPKATFFDLSATGTGLVPVVVGGFSKMVPFEFAGNIKPEFQQSTTALTNMVNQIVTRLQNSPQFAEGERKSLLGELDLKPGILQNRTGYINRLVAIDNVFESKEKQATEQSQVKEIGIPARNRLYGQIGEYRYIRDQLGIRDRKINSTEQWNAAPPGEYLVLDPAKGIYVLGTKAAPTTR
jgi:hypothetical protein